MTDAVSSFAILIGTAFMIFYKFNWINPLLTTLILVCIFNETYEIFNEALDVILMSSPKEIELNEL